MRNLAAEPRVFAFFVLLSLWSLIQRQVFRYLPPGLCSAWRIFPSGTGFHCLCLRGAFPMCDSLANRTANPNGPLRAPVPRSWCDLAGDCGLFCAL